ncbi:MAG: response regulator [Mariprofundaceae bacterium]
MVHIIDDDCVYRKVMLQIILDLGFNAIAFSSGSSYLKHMERSNYKQPQVIFSDMNMPGLSGLATLRKVMSSYPDIPCYLVTGNMRQFEQMNLSDVAIREILRKPVQFQKIELILQSLKQGRL